MSAGASEIVEVPAEVCWPRAILEPPVTPVQPETDRIAKSNKLRAETGIACIAMKRAGNAQIMELADTPFLSGLFIADDCGLWSEVKLLSLRTFIGQGS
jgi:hypothetical protein